jgi:DNA-directed RNA polymerase specialized sigma subunit
MKALDFAFLPRVVTAKTIRQMPGLDAWREDLQQEGMIALLLCERGYKPGFGSGYSYALRAVKTAVHRASKKYQASTAGHVLTRDTRDSADLDANDWSQLAGSAPSPERVAEIAHDARVVRALLISKRNRTCKGNPVGDVDSFLRHEFGDQTMRQAYPEGTSTQAAFNRVGRVRELLPAVAEQLQREAA